LARQLGFSDEQLSSISSNSWSENNEFSEKEKAVLDWADATTDMSARNKHEAFHKMTKYFTNSEIVELTYTTALWNCTNRLAEALHITAEPPHKGINWDKK
jgi:alkylhydroperoxidase family enzyme